MGKTCHESILLSPRQIKNLVSRSALLASSQTLGGRSLGARRGFVWPRKRPRGTCWSVGNASLNPYRRARFFAPEHTLIEYKLARAESSALQESYRIGEPKSLSRGRGVLARRQGTERTRRSRPRGDCRTPERGTPRREKEADGGDWKPDCERLVAYHALPQNAASTPET